MTRRRLSSTTEGPNNNGKKANGRYMGLKQAYLAISESSDVNPTFQSQHKDIFNLIDIRKNLIELKDSQLNLRRSDSDT